MSILGNRVVRREDPALLTGHGTFVDNLPLEGAAWVTFVRSPMAHARIDEIETDEALAAPGVLAVVTAQDLDLPDLVPFGASEHPLARPLLARDFVRFAGEPVGAVVTERPEQGPDAAELVWVDLEPLPALTDPLRSAESEVLLFADHGSNVALAFDPMGQTADLSACDVVVRLRTHNQRLAACPIEARVATAWWDGDHLTVQTSCQGAHPIRDEIARCYDLDHGQIRVVCPDVGGSFGAKATAYPEQLLLPELARRIDRPVRWSETRSENMLAMGHGRGQIQDVELGGDREGRITGYRLHVTQDAGAYPMIGASLPFMTRMMLTGVYAVDNAEFTSRSVLTSTTPTVAYRGAGRPEATAAIERAVDRYAAEIGMDPAEVRRRNLVTDDAFPYTNAMGTTYDTGAYARALDLALEAAGYDGLRAEQRARRAAGTSPALGIGVSTYVEITAVGAGSEYGSVELRPDGTVLALTGSNPYGQGHHTAWSMLISDRLGIPMDRIEIVHGDTDLVPSGSITGGSRSAQLAGTAMAVASTKLAEIAGERAAELLEAAAEDVTLDRSAGTFHVVGTPAVSVTWEEVAGAGDPLVGVSDFETDQSTFPFGAHVAVVEVDLETGDARLLRLVACDDAGTILNPLLVEGQVHGGLAQGAAQALYEQMRYDDDGNPMTANFADYAVISATELPLFERVPLETPTPVNELGAKGIGESGTIGSTPAIQNAVVDALAHLGVEHVDMPCTPERIWRALREVTEAAPTP